MAFGRLAHEGPRNHVLDRGQDETAMWPFVKILWPLVQ